MTSPRTALAHRFSVAPMMDWTDRHCRYFHRQLSAHARLYTEMLTTGALLHGDAARLLRKDASEHPVALQLGGADPNALARCAELGERSGYDEINLNCGCPSDRVQEGRFGACLMREPEVVARSVRAMRAATNLPVTVKHRIGVDDSEGYAFLRQFVETIATAGCEVFIVHARKAWLRGLSPKENREIPPLQYELVYRLKQDFPSLTVVLNGGIRSLGECTEHLRHVDGVMLGREAYDNPFLVAETDAALFGSLGSPLVNACPEPGRGRGPGEISRTEALLRLRGYVEAELALGTPLHRITRHVLGLFRGQPGGRAFRRILSTGATRPGATWALVEEALAAVERKMPHSLTDQSIAA